MKTLNSTTLILLASLGAGACAERKSPTRPAPVQAESPKKEIKPTAAASSAPTTKQAASSWTRVDDPSQVCMVNNQFMGRPQIPIAVEGKTYYGCCEMCKTRLGKDPTARTATDPLTQKPVDKAVAVIAKRADGSVAYFESEQNLAAYTSKN